MLINFYHVYKNTAFDFIFVNFLHFVCVFNLFGFFCFLPTDCFSFSAPFLFRSLTVEAQIVDCGSLLFSKLSVNDRNCPQHCFSYMPHISICHCCFDFLSSKTSYNFSLDVLLEASLIPTHLRVFHVPFRHWPRLRPISGLRTPEV